MNKEEIIEALSNLDKSDLKDVRSHIDYMLHKKTKQREEVTISLFYSILCKKIEEVTGQQPIPLIHIQQNSKTTYNSLIETHDYIIEHCSKLLNRKLDRTDMLKAFNIYALVVINSLRKEDSTITLTLNTALTVRGQFPSLLERSFPGYAAIALSFI
jgi:hypothetical protein